jgi:hypothetical protein
MGFQHKKRRKGVSSTYACREIGLRSHSEVVPGIVNATEHLVGAPVLGIIDCTVRFVVNIGDFVVGAAETASTCLDASVRDWRPNTSFQPAGATGRVRDVDAFQRGIAQLQAVLEAGKTSLGGNVTTGIVDMIDDVVGADGRVINGVVILTVRAVEGSGKGNRG